MKKIRSKLETISTGKNVMLFLLIYMIFQLGIIFILTPAWAAHSNKPLLDARFEYSVQEAYEYLHEILPGNKSMYQLIGIIDTLFAVIYSMFYATLLMFVYKKAFNNSSPLLNLIIIPLIGGFFDVIENIGIQILIITFPEELKAVAWFTGLCTSLKFVVLPLTFILLITGLVKLILKRMGTISS